MLYSGDEFVTVVEERRENCWGGWHNALLKNCGRLIVISMLWKQGLRTRGDMQGTQR